MIDVIVRALSDQAWALGQIDHTGVWQVQACGDGYAELSKVLAGRSFHFMIPSQKLRLTKVYVPHLKRYERQQALQYALESEVLDDIADLHVTVVEALPGDYYRVLIVDKTVMQTWLNDLKAAGVSPEAILPDFLLFRCQPDAWSLVGGPLVMLREGQSAGMAMMPDHLPLILSRLVESAPMMPQRCRVDPALALPAELLEDPRFCFEKTTAVFECEPTLRQRYQPLNLLVGAFKPQRLRSLPEMAVVARRALVGCLSLWCGLHMLAWGYFSYQWHGEKRAYRHYQAQWGQQMVQTIAARTAASVAVGNQPRWLASFRSIGMALQVVATVRLISLRYEPHRLVITLTAARMADMQQFANALGRQPVNIVNKTVKATQDAVQMTVVIKEEGA